MLCSLFFNKRPAQITACFFSFFLFLPKIICAFDSRILGLESNPTAELFPVVIFFSDFFFMEDEHTWCRRSLHSSSHSEALDVVVALSTLSRHKIVDTDATGLDSRIFRFRPPSGLPNRFR